MRKKIPAFQVKLKIFVDNCTIVHILSLVSFRKKKCFLVFEKKSAFSIFSFLMVEKFNGSSFLMNPKSMGRFL